MLHIKKNKGGINTYKLVSKADAHTDGSSIDTFKKENHYDISCSLYPKVRQPHMTSLAKWYDMYKKDVDHIVQVLLHTLYACQSEKGLTHSRLDQMGVQSLRVL